MRYSNFKPLLATTLTGLLALGAFVPAFADQFNDTSGNWAQSAIDNLSGQGIISGYPNGQFRPTNPITRAEFASILVKAQHAENDSNSGQQFSDVPASYWGARAIGIASAHGWVTGYPGGEFRPNQDISRAEAMVVLDKIANVPAPSQQEANQILSNYSDGQSVPNWARPAVAAAIHAGIFSSYPNANQINPQTDATRADIASLTQNTLAYLNGGVNTARQERREERIAQREESAYQSPDNTIHARVAVVPGYTKFQGVITQTISTATNHIGDPVSVTLNQPLTTATGQTAVPQGSQLLGTISSLQPAGRVEGGGKIGITFNQIQLPDGRTFPASARIDTEDGLLSAGSTKGRVGNIAARTAGGAVVGGAAGALLGDLLHGNHHGIVPGLATGAALGGVAGAGSGVLARGQELTLQAGDDIAIRLNQNLSIDASQSGY